MLGLAMVYMHTKFEVSMFTHYDDIKGNATTNWEWFGIVRGHPRSSAT